MTLVTQILIVFGAALIIYAVYGIFALGNQSGPAKINAPAPAPAEDPGKEQKLQRLLSQVAQLENELTETKAAALQEKSEFSALKDKEAGFNAELKRREEWVAKAEAELAKIKAENTELTNRFTAKEKELEEEFTKNVNLVREVREIKAALETKEMACRLKDDQVQAQKCQIETQAKAIKEHTAVIAEYSRKEKISEWVPKSEFNQLNEEYTKLEKELEAAQERLKNFAVEITHLRAAQDNAKIPPAEAEEIVPPQAAQEPPATGQEAAALETKQDAAENMKVLAEPQPEPEPGSLPPPAAPKTASEKTEPPAQEQQAPDQPASP